MVKNGQKDSTLKQAGYAALIERFALDVIPNWHKSMVAAAGTHRVESIGGVVEETYPAKYWPGDTLGGADRLPGFADGDTACSFLLRARRGDGMRAS